MLPVRDLGVGGGRPGFQLSLCLTTTAVTLTWLLCLSEPWLLLWRSEGVMATNLESLPLCHFRATGANVTDGSPRETVALLAE